MRELHGACHCGDVRYVLEWPDAVEPALRSCNCSYCVKQGGIYASHPDAALRVSLRAADALSSYEFGTSTARFQSCRRCGAFLYAVSTIDGSDRAVLNARSLDDFTAPPTVPLHSFEGETKGDRLGRRERNWIGTVTVTVAAG